MTIVSFLFFLFIFALVGVSSFFFSKKTGADYFLASRTVSSWATALSAVSTNNSGFMFIGLIGTAYLWGVPAFWIAFGYVFGDFISWFFIHKKLREESVKRDALTYPSFISSFVPEKHAYLVRVISAILVIVFLGTYAAAQMSASSKALFVLFGWPYEWGILLAATIILLYCWSGGIRASIWTDVAQSVVMIIAMTLLVIVALFHIGGFEHLYHGLHHIDKDLVSIVPATAYMSVPFFIVGWIAGGMGVVGQPHIMVRFMALQSSDLLRKTRVIYFVWYSIFAMAAFLVGLCARVLLPSLKHIDTELALPQLSIHLFPPLVTGLILAGLFAATISTADSQVLSCSSAFSHDLLPKKWHSYKLTKLSTVAITLIATFISIWGTHNVFALVTIAWSALGAVFAPLIYMNLNHYVAKNFWTLLMMVGGLSGVLTWRFALGLSDQVYEIFPGLVIAGLIFLLGRLTGNITKDYKEHRPKSPSQKEA